MSKMPAKKKSCFQITSVTTAQGSGSLADDTESLDGDPDESRSEDVSSEVFDVSRREGPGPQPVTTGHSSSKETLNHAGSPGTVFPNPLQAPAAPVTCSSRFRVIKLDHGSGEPYRRGRWTCVEYYEQETDTIRHGHATEPSGERDSGLGGSQVGLEPLADNTVSHLGQAPLQQHFLIGQQHPQAEAVPPQPLHSGQHMVVQGQSQTGHNGKGGPKGMAGPAGHNGKGEVAPPVSQAQQFAYFQSQVAPAQRNPAQFIKDVFVDSVKLAIDLGYRHIDSAIYYQNEAEIGEAVQAKIADGTVKREELFYTGKVWSTLLSPEMVRPNLEKSLKKLKFDYMDLFLIHWPVSLKAGDNHWPLDENGKMIYGNVDFCDTWEAMEACKDAGLVKSIGVSNFNPRQLQRLLSKPGLKYRPVVNQVECHPYLTQNKLLTFCKAHDIALVCYSVLGTSDAQYWENRKIPILLEDPVLLAIAEQHKSSPSQIAIRFIIQQSMVALTKSKSPERIKSNMQVFDFQLTNDDMKSLEGLNKNYHFWSIDEFKEHPEYPFNED